MSETSEGIRPTESAAAVLPSSQEIENEGLLIEVQEAVAAEAQDSITGSVAHPEGIPSDLKQEYEGRRAEMEKLYGEAAYWHGTGRKQHRNGELDILDGILEDGGLVPSQDPYDLKTGVVETISLSDRRPYSALYAKMHLTDTENLGYEYMDRMFWGNIFIRNTILEAIGRTRFERLKKAGGFAIRALRDYIKEGKNPIYLLSLRKNSREWFSKVRSEKPRVSLNRVSTVRSDIPGNYPILIGVREDAFTPAKTAKYIAMYEVRVDTPISIGGFTHIEVPHAHVQETQDYLTQKGKGNLLVVAMELGGVNSSQFSPQQLVEGNPFRK